MAKGRTPSEGGNQPPVEPSPPAEVEADGIPAAVLETVPDNARIAYVQSISFKGPLPPPALLKEYDKVKPGLADTIIAMAQTEQDHRHKWEASSLKAHHSDRRLGLWLGFGIAAIGMASASVAAFLGYPWVAASALVPAVGGILAHIIRRPHDEPD